MLCKNLRGRTPSRATTVQKKGKEWSTHVHARKLTHMEFLWKSEAAKFIVSEENQEAGSRVEKFSSPLF